MSQQRPNGADPVVAAAGTVSGGEEIVSIMDFTNMGDQKGVCPLLANNG